MEDLPFNINPLDGSFRRTVFRLTISARPTDAELNGQPVVIRMTDADRDRRMEVAGYQEEGEQTVMVALELGSDDPVSNQRIQIGNTKYLVKSVLPDLGTNCYQLKIVPL